MGLLETLGFRDPLLAMTWFIVAGTTGLLIGILTRRPKSGKNATTERPSEPGEPRLIDLTRGREKRGDPVLEALVTRTEKLLREAMEKNLVEPRLYSPRCPEARVVIDPVSMEVLCIDAEKGEPLEAEEAETTGEGAVIEEAEEEPEAGEREARKPKRRGREA